MQGGYMDSKRIRLRKNIEMQYLKLQLEPTNPQGGSLCGWCNLNQIRKKKTRSGCPWKSGQKAGYVSDPSGLIVIQKFRRSPG
jgi:hypothetical protein